MCFRRVATIIGLVVFSGLFAVAPVSAQEPGNEPDRPVVAPTTTVAPPDGPPIAKLSVPKIELTVDVYSGITNPALSNGVGHYPNTVLPGEIGNTGIAGHRYVESAPFDRISELAADDTITVTMSDGTVHDYKVTETAVLAVDDPTILTVTDGKALTLTAAEGDGSEQFVVRAVIPGSEGVTAPLAQSTPVVEGPAPTSENNPGSTGMYVFGMLAVAGVAGTVLSFARR